MRLISVVMGTNSPQARTTASKNLLSYGFRFYDTKQVMQQNHVRISGARWKGDIEQVSAKIAEDAYLTMPRGLVDSLQKSVVMIVPSIAPVEQELRWASRLEEQRYYGGKLRFSRRSNCRTRLLDGATFRQRQTLVRWPFSDLMGRIEVNE